MKLLSTITFALCLSVMAIGQKFALQTDQGFTGDIFTSGYESLENKKHYSDAKGSPYAHPEFQYGYALFNTGDTINAYFRYDMYADQMEFLDDAVVKYITNIHKITQIKVGPDVYQYTAFSDAGVTDKTFLITEIVGPCTLYKQKDVSYQEASPGRTGYDDPIPAEFKSKKDSWWASSDGQPARKINSNKQLIFDLFGDHTDAMQKYMKSEKLKIKKPDDLRKIVSYYNELASKS